MIITKKLKIKIIDDALQNVDFNFVLKFYQTLGIEYPKIIHGELTTEIIKEHLTILLEKILNNTQWETIDSHWLVYYNPHAVEDTAIQVQIYFTPLAANIYQFKDIAHKKDELEKKLENAIFKEDYLLAAKIKKQIDKVNKKK